MGDWIMDALTLKVALFDTAVHQSFCSVSGPTVCVCDHSLTLHKVSAREFHISIKCKTDVTIECGVIGHNFAG